MQFQFHASKLKAYFYAIVGTVILSWTYRQLKIDAAKAKDTGSYDVLFYEKSTNRKLIGVNFEIDEYVDGDVSYST
jgi:hypothetical protein